METILSFLFWAVVAVISFFVIIMAGGLLVQVAEKIFGKNFWEEK